MSCRERERAWRRVNGKIVTENEVVRRLVVSSIAWLGLEVRSLSTMETSKLATTSDVETNGDPRSETERQSASLWVELASPLNEDPTTAGRTAEQIPDRKQDKSAKQENRTRDRR